MITLKDLCDKGSSNIAQKDIENNNGEFPIYGASGFIKNVDFYKQEKPYIAIVKDGAGVGRVMKLPAMSSVIGTMQYIIPNEGVNVDYLAYALESMNLAKYHSGATIPHIYFKDYCKEVLPEHSKLEQNRIAVELSKIDSLITARREQLAKLDELVKSRFVELFGDFIEHTTPIDFESICEFVTVGIANSATHAFCDDGVIMFRNQNIKEDYLDTSDIVHITLDFANKYKSKMLKKDDLLIVRTGYPGVACLVPKQYEGCQTFTTLIARIKHGNAINPRFVCHYINSEYGKNYVRDNSAGAAQQNFGATALSKLPICIPSIELQDEYIRFVEQTDKSKFEIQQSLEKLETLKKALMQKYFG